MFKIEHTVGKENMHLLSAMVNKDVYEAVDRLARKNKTHKTKVVRQMIQFCVKETN